MNTSEIVKFGGVRRSKPPAYAHVNSYIDCVEAALTCCAQARDASRHGRIQAAKGLLQTAISMYSRAERLLANSSAHAPENRFDEMVDDLCYSAQVIEVESVARRNRSAACLVGDV